MGNIFQFFQKLLQRLVEMVRNNEEEGRRKKGARRKKEEEGKREEEEGSGGRRERKKKRRKEWQKRGAGREEEEKKGMAVLLWSREEGERENEKAFCATDGELAGGRGEGDGQPSVPPSPTLLSSEPPSPVPVPAPPQCRLSSNRSSTSNLLRATTNASIDSVSSVSSPSLLQRKQRQIAVDASAAAIMSPRPSQTLPFFLLRCLPPFPSSSSSAAFLPSLLPLPPAPPPSLPFPSLLPPSSFLLLPPSFFFPIASSLLGAASLVENLGVSPESRSALGQTPGIIAGNVAVLYPPTVYL